MEKKNLISPFQFLRMGLSPSAILYETILEEIQLSKPPSYGNFSSLVSLYRFDQKLKKLLFTHIQSIEEKLRALLTYHFCHHFDHSFDAYLDFEHYQHIVGNESEIFQLIHKLSQLEHQRCLSAEPSSFYPPVWTKTKAIPFYLLVDIYRFSKPQIQKDISFHFYRHTPDTLSRLFFFLSTFLEITVLDDACLLNTRIRSKLPDLELHRKLHIPKKMTGEYYGKNDVFALLLALNTLLPPSQFQELDHGFLLLLWDFLEENPDIDTHRFLRVMGIPPHALGGDKFWIFDL